MEYLFDKMLFILQKMESYLAKLQDETTGAIFCKEHKSYHTRAAEAALIFATLYKYTRDLSYAKRAIKLIDWLISKQSYDGSWPETEYMLLHNLYQV